MKKSPSLFGGMAIIASVCVGAGMLGLPTAGAGAWTLWSTLALCLTMVVMTASGWLLLEAYAPFDKNASFSTVTKALLGPQANLLNNLAVYFVGGILLYAYTSVSGDILHNLLGDVPVLGKAYSARFWSVLFVIVFSFIVWHSTRAVDRVAILLVIFMLLAFGISISGLASTIKLEHLLDLNNPDGSYSPYFAAMLPVALTSFGYHHSVTTMRAYYDNEHKAKYAILGGTVIALVFYLLWVFSIFGNLPREAMAPIVQAKGDVSMLINTIAGANAGYVNEWINAFSIAAILSSFIGVGLGVFDFLADFFGFSNTPKGRFYTWAATFLPPLVLSVSIPFGFITAIGFAGAVATIWTCFIPALLIMVSRKKGNNTGRFTVPYGKALALLIAVYGVCAAVFHFMSMANKLPVFGA